MIRDVRIFLLGMMAGVVWMGIMTTLYLISVGYLPV
jgi:hypothetical protein